MRGSSRLLLSAFIFVFFSIQVVASKIHVIYWNASNPLFHNGDYELNVRLGDKIRMICPQVRTMDSDDGAYLIIHKDSEMAHMNCVLESPRVVTLCNDPRQPFPVTYATTVRKYRVNEQGLEMEPGMTHYYLSTSSGTNDPAGMNKKMEGMCKHDHMRLKIVVDELDPATVVDTTRIHPTPSPAPSTTSSTSSNRGSVSMSSSIRTAHEQRRHTHREHKEEDVSSYSESDMRDVYTIHSTSQEQDVPPPSGWDAVRMNADEIVGDFRGAYGAPDYIISEHSSSAVFSLVLLSIILLISFR